MYQYDKKHIEINGNIYDFDFDIRTVIQYKERFIVLLGDMLIFGGRSVTIV